MSKLRSSWAVSVMEDRARGNSFNIKEYTLPFNVSGFLITYIRFELTEPERNSCFTLSIFNYNEMILQSIASIKAVTNMKRLSHAEYTCLLCCFRDDNVLNLYCLKKHLQTLPQVTAATASLDLWYFNYDLRLTWKKKTRRYKKLNREHESV